MVQRKKRKEEEENSLATAEIYSARVTSARLHQV